MLLHITEVQFDKLIPWMIAEFHPACVSLLAEQFDESDCSFDLTASLSEKSDLEAQSLFFFEPIDLEEESTDWGEVWGIIITKDDSGYRIDSVQARGDDSHFSVEEINDECNCTKLLLTQYRIKEFIFGFAEPSSNR